MTFLPFIKCTRTRTAAEPLLLNLLDIFLGGASGIGRAVCQALAAEGASVVVTDLNNQKAEETTDSLLKHADNKHLNYSLDVAKGEEVQKVLECIISEYRKPPCILVNSAGIISDDLLLKMEEEKFDKVIEVNLKVKISQKNCKQSYCTCIQLHSTELSDTYDMSLVHEMITYL